MSRKTVLVTGASRGLGLCLVRSALEEGALVLAGARDPLAAGLKELGQRYPENLIILKMDVADTRSVEEAAAEAARYTDRLDLVINNAGIHSDTSFLELEKTNVDDCLSVYNVNTLGPLRVMKAFLGLMEKAGEENGCLAVNISSESGSIGTAGRKKEFDYCMSKAALNMGTRLLDNYLEERGIRVIAVHPGWMRTDMGGANADLDPYETACQLTALFEKTAREKDGPIFMDNEGRVYPW